MKQRIFAGVTFMFLAVVTFGQQSKEAPVFHGLKLGLTLGSQLKPCSIPDDSIVDGPSSEFCFLATSEPEYVQILRGGQVWPEEDSQYSVSVLIPADSEDVAVGTVEGLYLPYNMDEASRVLASLKAKYGQKSNCSKKAKQTGIGLPITARIMSLADTLGLRRL